MAISGTSCTTCSSSYLSATDTNKLRQGEKSQNLEVDLNDNKSSSREPAEFIFRGELLDEVNQNNGFRSQKDQTIDPANQSAINRYEDNNTPTSESASLLVQRQGAILDAYA